MKAVCNGVTLAESDNTIDLAGVEYFPIDSVKEQYFLRSDLHTTCHIKGLASYYDIAVDGYVREDAAWYYPDPVDGYREIKGHVDFYTTPDAGISIFH